MQYLIVSDYRDNIRDSKCVSDKTPQWEKEVIAWVNTPDTKILLIPDEVQFHPVVYMGVSQRMRMQLITQPSWVH